MSIRCEKDSRKNEIDALLDLVAEEEENDEPQAMFSDGWDDAIEASDSDSEAEEASSSQSESKILYHNHACVKNGSEMKFITHEAITPAIVAAGFYELVGSHIQASDKVYSQSHIRLFFDIDIKNDDGVMYLNHKRHGRHIMTYPILKPLVQERKRRYRIVFEWH